MTKQKSPAPVKRQSGYLTCRRCRFFIPYQGYSGEPAEDRPQHRCGYDIRPFDSFSFKQPPSGRSH